MPTHTYPAKSPLAIHFRKPKERGYVGKDGTNLLVAEGEFQ